MVMNHVVGRACALSSVLISCSISLSKYGLLSGPLVGPGIPESAMSPRASFSLHVASLGGHPPVIAFHCCYQPDTVTLAHSGVET